MPQNNCTPQNVYGPFEHTLFLGCSVQSFSVTAGYNNQVTELTVRVARDPCVPSAGSKTYYDDDYQEQTWTGPDPGFFAPDVGVPVYFRVNEFEFSGLIQSWVQSSSPEGYPVYDIVIVDPRQVLEGAQVIIGAYAGSVANTPNVVNVFGFMESFGVYDPQTTINGATFGTPAGGFGGSYSNENGMPWNRIRAGLGVLLGSSTIVFSNEFSPYGRLVFRGNATTTVYGINGCGLMSADIAGQSYYIVDLSELPVDDTGLVRIPGVAVGLLDLISQVCSEAGCDYYIELVPVFIWKMIKVRVVSRVAVPVFGEIAAFVGSAVGVKSNTIGLELRNEVTSAIIVGGNQQTIYQAFQEVNPPGTPQEPSTPPDENRWVILPYWGTNPDGSIIETTYEDGLWHFQAPTLALNFQLVQPLNAEYIKINEAELRFALMGMDSWLSWIAAKQTETWSAVNDANGGDDNKQGVFKLEEIKVIAHEVERLATRDFTSPKHGYRDIDADLEKDLQTIFNFVATFAKDYYGRRFSIRIPYTAVTTDPETGLRVTSEVPSDGGWTDADTILGLENPSVSIDFFTNEDNRIGPFVAIPRFCGENQDEPVDVSNMNIDDFGVYGNYVYVRASVDQQVYWLGGSPRVVVNLPQAVLCHPPQGTIQKASHGVVAGLQAVQSQEAADAALKALKGTAGNLLNWGIEHTPMFIYAACVPLKSNIATYADNTWAIIGTAGATKMEQDENLTPWNYGGTANMVAAGQAKVAQELTAMQVGEMGTVSVAGYPTLPLGAEIGSYTGLGGKGLYENRTYTTTGFNEVVGPGGNWVASVLSTDIMANGWVGLYGPNITQINVEVGPQGASTQYVMRSFTPKFGKFTKYNADRIRNQGLTRLRNQRMARKVASLNAASVANRDPKNVEDRRQVVNAVNARNSKTPHEVLVGEVFDWHKTTPGDDEFSRTIVATEDMKELGLEFKYDYDKKAIMSLDGLVRPVSLFGAGGLPQMASKSLGCFKAGPNTAIPPISGSYNLEISNTYLNFLAGPNDSMHGTCMGHDIDIVGRHSSPPSSIIMPIANYDDQSGAFASDYRFFAMRGPIWIHGWGYDLHGKPVPNAVSGAAASSGARSDRFLEDWMRKPETWKLGPLDVRWDEQRAVWTCPPSHKILRVKLAGSGSLTSEGSCEAYILNNISLFDSGGTRMPTGTGGTKITVHGGSLGFEVPPSGKLSVYYDPDDCKYYPFGGPAATTPTGSGNITMATGIILSESGGQNFIDISWATFRMAATFVSGFQTRITLPSGGTSTSGSCGRVCVSPIDVVVGGSCVSGQVQLITQTIYQVCNGTTGCC